MQLWLDCPSPPPARPFINCIVTAKFLACCWYWNALDWTQVCHLWSELLSLFLMCLCENIFCCSRWKLLEEEHISSTSLVFFFSKPFYIRIMDVFFVKAISCTASKNMCLLVSCIWLFSVLMLEWTHDNKEALTFFLHLLIWMSDVVDPAIHAFISLMQSIWLL